MHRILAGAGPRGAVHARRSRPSRTRTSYRFARKLAAETGLIGPSVGAGSRLSLACTFASIGSRRPQSCRTIFHHEGAVSDLPEHVRKNRAKWDKQAEQYAAAGERHWALEVPAWGIWQVPETELRLLPDDLTGNDAIQLGCATAYVSSCLPTRSARVGGFDHPAPQLATAS